MGVYFDLYPSGTYSIQLRATVRLNDEVGDGTQYLVLTNSVRNIVVNNEVTFTNWNDLISGSNFTFHAQTKTNNTDWWIEIYDAGNNYVNGGLGHTTNGLVSWTWNLKDTTGNRRDNLDSDPFLTSYITFAAAGGAQTTRYTPAVQTPYPDLGYWLITYSDRHILDAGTNYSGVNTYYTNGIAGLAGGPALHDIPASVFAIKFGTNAYTQAQRNDSWATLKTYIFDPHYRNLYYHGHGNPNVIGSDVHVFDTNGYVTGGIFLPGSKAFLTSQSVSNELTFNRYAGSRPYRFVWLDGCSTANGNWPGAFGVNKATNNLSYYTNSVTNPKHMRPSVFVGWNQIVGGKDWGSASAAWNFRTEWMFDWSYWWFVDTVIDSYSVARNNASWPPGGDGQLWGALRVYGYTDLKMGAYNHKDDW